MFQKFWYFLSEVRVFWHWVDYLTGAAELREAILKPFRPQKLKPILASLFPSFAAARRGASRARCGRVAGASRRPGVRR